MARKKKTDAANADGIQNVITGLGDYSFDKRLYSTHQVENLTARQLIDIYRSNPFAARIVDLPVHEMFRAGFELKVDGDEELPKKLKAQADDLNLFEVFYEAKRLERLFGGSLILIGAKDSAMGDKRLSEPLDLNALQAVESLSVFDATEVSVLEWEANPLSKDFGKPVRFSIYPASLGTGASAILGNVHASRCIWFGGIRATRDALRQSSTSANPGWGDSVLTRVHWIVRDLGATWESVAGLLQDYSVAVLHLNGLNSALLGDKDQVVIKRLQTTQLMRSMFRGYVLDKEESFERKATPITGLTEILDRFSEMLAASAGIPVTVLFGQAPAGLNATGDSDVRMFYDSIKSRQQNELKPCLEKVYKMLLMAKRGAARGREPESWGVEFHPLWQISDVEKAGIRLQMAQADNIYIQAGVLDPHEVAEARFGGDMYSVDTEVEREVDDEGEPMEGEESAPAQSASPRVIELAKAVTKGELPKDAEVLAALGMPLEVAQQLVKALESKDNGPSNVSGASAGEVEQPSAPAKATESA